MSPWLFAFIDSFFDDFKKVFDFIGSCLAEKARADAQEAGAAKAEAETLSVITERANAQNDLDRVDRSARSVGERLRQSAAKDGA